MLGQQQWYDEVWRKGLAAGKEQRGNLRAHLELLHGSDVLRPAARVLEIGCGIGSVVADLDRSGHEVVGVDISREAVAYGREKYAGIRLEVHPAENLPFADQTFDVVLSFDVIEHLADVDAHLAEAVRVLRPQGHYLLQTPAKIFAMVSETLFHRSLSWRDHHPSLHTPAQLRRRLLEHGFTVRFVKIDPVDEYAVTKFGLPRFVLRLARIVRWTRLPLVLQPNLFVVARSCAS